ncbi:MAG: helix-turn-helix transcriptional regulator [Parasporobacterium sp.]|nr:helix-turn-helix transcriptional regulator [Parasporobacterium sp.]
MFDEILKNKKLTIKDISEGANVPRSTIADLVSGKTSIEKMSAGVLFKLGSYLGINMQDLYEYCRLQKIEDYAVFIEKENDTIINNGLKSYVKALAENNLIETAYALNDKVRFQKYMSAVRDFYKYRKLELPERYTDYIICLEE